MLEFETQNDGEQIFRLLDLTPKLNAKSDAEVRRNNMIRYGVPAVAAAYDNIYQPLRLVTPDELPMAHGYNPDGVGG